MHVHGPSHLHGPQPISPPHGVKPTEQMHRPDAPQIADEVDISEAARLAEQIQQMPDIRGDRVEAVRRQIAEGTYETRDKLHVAVERLLDEIG
ncbi:MAG: flagellar biosynthesis anti-sigma factor FlgM [Pirellulales bacterium]|nr:flagellar biosynthesis anti-sigma factor FlgM [Pirellulales bacterium]